MNLVELMADPEEMRPAPCAFGNIVDRHACYCHNEASGYRKCPVWREFGEDASKWSVAACEWFEENNGS